MIKNNKGVTLVVLTITIITMLIILGISVTTATNLLKETNTRKLKTNLHLIEARAQTLLDDYLFDGTDNLGKETTKDISKYGWTENELQFIYREWNKTMLKDQGIDVKNMASNEIFIIQYDVINERVDVASVRGIVDVDGKDLYTLTDLKGK